MSIPFWRAPITSGFLEPFALDSGGTNKGLDFGANPGQTIDAIAYRGGIVIQAGPGHDGWGTSVKIRGADGTTYNFGHLNAVNVQVGDTVNPGDLVGQVDGDQPTNGTSTGPHLSVDIWNANGEYLDPGNFVSDQGPVFGGGPMAPGEVGGTISAGAGGLGGPFAPPSGPGLPPGPGGGTGTLDLGLNPAQAPAIPGLIFDPNKKRYLKPDGSVAPPTDIQQAIDAERARQAATQRAGQQPQPQQHFVNTVTGTLMTFDPNTGGYRDTGVQVAQPALPSTAVSPDTAATQAGAAERQAAADKAAAERQAADIAAANQRNEATIAFQDRNLKFLREKAAVEEAAGKRQDAIATLGQVRQMEAEQQQNLIQRATLKQQAVQFQQTQRQNIARDIAEFGKNPGDIGAQAAYLQANPAGAPISEAIAKGQTAITDKSLSPLALMLQNRDRLSQSVDLGLPPQTTNPDWAKLLDAIMGGLGVSSSGTSASGAAGAPPPGAGGPMPTIPPGFMLPPDVAARRPWEQVGAPPFEWWLQPIKGSQTEKDAINRAIAGATGSLASPGLQKTVADTIPGSFYVPPTVPKAGSAEVPFNNQVNPGFNPSPPASAYDVSFTGGPANVGNFGAPAPFNPFAAPPPPAWSFDNPFGGNLPGYAFGGLTDTSAFQTGEAGPETVVNPTNAPLYIDPNGGSVSGDALARARAFLQQAFANARMGTPWATQMPTPAGVAAPGMSPFVQQAAAGLAATGTGFDPNEFLREALRLTPIGLPEGTNIGRSR